MSAARAASALGRACAGLLTLGLAACQTPARAPSAPAPAGAAAPAPAPPSAPAAASLPHLVLVRSQLASVVQAQGLPCAAVVGQVRTRRLDYQVVCDTGQVYRVWVSAEGRVMVQPLVGSAPADPLPRSAQPPASAPG